MVDNTQGTQKFSRRKEIYEYTPENDIKYRGPLSYRMLKIAGWIALAFSQYLLIAKLNNNIIKIDEPIAFGNTINGIIVDLALPLLLFGNFALLLNGQNKFRTHFLINGGASIAFIIVYFIVYQRYAVDFASVFVETRDEAISKLDTLFYALNISYDSFHGFVAFNIFIDMFLCTLGWFFIVYTPKKCFKGKKIIIFRSFILIPLIYEIVCIVLKIRATSLSELLPVNLFPFLTTKPPLVFILFMALGIYIKIRERKFLKHGKTKEDYQVFLKTNKNSLDIMLFAIAVMLVVIAIDEFLLKNLIVPRIVEHNMGITHDEYYATAYEFLVAPAVSACGIGEMKSMLLFTPLLLLFSYTRTHKHTIIDSGIAVLGIAGIALIYLDGIMGIIKNLLIIFRNSEVYDIVVNSFFPLE